MRALAEIAPDQKWLLQVCDQVAGDWRKTVLPVRSQVGAQAAQRIEPGVENHKVSDYEDDRQDDLPSIASSLRSLAPPLGIQRQDIEGEKRH